MFKWKWLSVTLLAAALTACGGDDADEDGFSVADGDCDDFAANVNPDAAEVPYNGIDDDCDSATPDDDLDGDGIGLARDCDDEDAGVNPDALETCNGIDDNCDGAIDNDPSDGTTYYLDADGDGFGGPTSEVACESPGDNYQTTSDDCDDTDDDVFPGAPEICDSEDNDCDNLIDADDDNFDASQLGTWYADTDNDGFGDPGNATDACFQPAGFVDDDNDCDDNNAAVSPDAVEVCNDVDDDCDTQIDNDPTDAPTWYQDVDTDGFGDSRFPLEACDQPAGYVLNDTDCDPLRGDVFPGATEICNDIDDDCDAAIDDADGDLDKSTGTVYHRDADSDTYGDASTAEGFCDQPTGYVLDATDCNDGAANINPGATEVCDAADIDEDCDNLADDADGSVDTAGFTTFFADTDSDTFGDPNSTTAACDVPTGFVADNTDCNDDSAGVNPGAQEVCDDNDVDEDCDGNADDADASVDTNGFTTFFADTDQDTFGDPNSANASCDLPSGFVTNDTDCDDNNAAINPIAQEVCDAADTDEDCDGLIDDADGSVDTNGFFTFYEDTDQDTFGDINSSAEACDVPTGFVADSTDCDDNNAGVNPGAVEVCDDADLDEDCDNLADDADDSVDAGDVQRVLRRRRSRHLR